MEEQTTLNDIVSSGLEQLPDLALGEDETLRPVHLLRSAFNSYGEYRTSLVGEDGELDPDASFSEARDHLFEKNSLIFFHRTGQVFGILPDMIETTTGWEAPRDLDGVFGADETEAAGVETGRLLGLASDQGTKDSPNLIEPSWMASVLNRIDSLGSFMGNAIRDGYEEYWETRDTQFGGPDKFEGLISSGMHHYGLNLAFVTDTVDKFLDLNDRKFVASASKREPMSTLDIDMPHDFESVELEPPRRSTGFER